MDHRLGEGLDQRRFSVGRVSIKLAPGLSLEGNLHSSLDPSQAKKLKCRLVDLKRAYRQLRRHVSLGDVTIFSLTGPDGETYYFEEVAVPFGSRNAVIGFNVHARVLKVVGAVGLYLVLSHYFDDFSQRKQDAFAESSA